MKIWQWIKTNQVILTNASSLVATTAITSVLGFVYWWLAARRFLPADVGIASAAVSAMLLLGSFCALGLGTLLITELPRQPTRTVSLMSTAVLIVASVGAVVGMLFALLAPFVSPDFRPLRATMLDVCLFAVGVSLTSVTLVLDQACIGLLRGGLQLWRNALFAFAKLLVLFLVSFWIAQKIGMTIYAAWACGNALSLSVLVLPLLKRKTRLCKSDLPQWSFLRKLGGAAMQHHLLNLTLQTPTFLLPVLVTGLLSASMNAWFYMSWMLANFVFVVSLALTTVLHATNSAQPAALAHKARVTIALSLLVSVIAGALLFGDTWQILSVFGRSYAQNATWCLRILTLAAFPLIIKNHYISICRIRDRVVHAMLGMLPGGILELVGAICGARVAGLTGVSIGWVCAIFVEAIFMLPYVYTAVYARAAVSEQSVDATSPLRLKFFSR